MGVPKKIFIVKILIYRCVLFLLKKWEYVELLKLCGIIPQGAIVEADFCMACIKWIIILTFVCGSILRSNRSL